MCVRKEVVSPVKSKTIVLFMAGREVEADIVEFTDDFDKFI